ncbi:type I restriction-modification system subunit M [Micrococcus luteus]|uniref:type I restriction-modification system subunit M n=1 Tax=Micrococcus luteus TaxID=1270 RepID=UPI002A3B3DAB|nr:type I restriction-modification system subunit M [Micrococcus luteus]
MTEDEAKAAAHALIPRGPSMTLSELESHLAKASDLLRGSIDQADFKAYIFPLLFFKRISDVYLEEYALALADSGGDHQFATFAENHRFSIPEGCLWDDLRERSENIGQALVTCFQEIEKANPDTLFGIFGQTSLWTNKQKFPDARLRDLIEHFSERPLTNALVPPDMFGQAYEYLIKRFADQSNKAAGEYYTPRSVVGMLVNILDPQERETVYDPACGTAGMLIEVINHVKENGGDPKLLRGRLFGQEKVLATSGIARMNLLLHGIDDFKIVRGDTLREPAFYDGDHLAQFDCVIANPPFSLDKWGAQTWASDPWRRNQFGGVPLASKGDWAWVQHMWASTAPTTGRVAVVLPQGALFRSGAEAKIRKWFLENDLVEAVIGLAPNLFYGTGLAACILVLRHRKPEGREQAIRVVNAEPLFRRGRNQNTLEPQHAEEILRLYQSDDEIAGRARLVPMSEVAKNDHNLNLTLYVAPEADADAPTLAEAVEALRQAQSDVRESRARLEAELAKWGL